MGNEDFTKSIHRHPENGAELGSAPQLWLIAGYGPVHPQRRVGFIREVIGQKHRFGGEE